MTLNLEIMKIRDVILILLILFSLASCVEKFWPEVDNYDNVLVVDGLLTNGDEQCVVRLSYSSSVNHDELMPITGGKLYIIDEEEVETPLTETDAGTYKIMDSSFNTQIGNSYQLHITLLNGKKYVSDICRMHEQSPIDSVYGLIETHQAPNSYEYLEGVQFYIDNHSRLNDTCYYLWNLVETFEYQSTFSIDYIWTGSFFDPIPNPDSLRTCWRTSTVNGIFTYSTKYLNEPIIVDFPLNFVSTQNKHLSIRYSLLVKQLSISESAFVFWDALRQQNIDNGNLYSQQPFQIKGNVKNVNNPEETVLGYFTVAGITEKRIYINRPPLSFHYQVCSPFFEGMRWIYYEPGPIYIVDVNGTMAMGNSDICFDCRLLGGSTTPPDFWVNE